MNKNFIKTISLISLIILNSCGLGSSIKSAVTGQTKPVGDEFLVEKKNPLTVPPNFDELPEPTGSTKENSAADSENEDDLQQIIDMAENDDSEEINESGSLENLILEEINQN